MIDYNKSKIHIFMAYIAKHKKAFVIDMILSALIAAVDLAFPVVTRQSMQNLLPGKLYRAFFVVMAILLIAYLLRAVFQYFVTVIGHKMGTLVEADMRRDVFTHMQSLSYSFFDNNRTGVLLSRVTNDLFEIVELAHHGPEHLLTCSLTIIGSLVVLFFVQWKLAIVLLILVPILLYFGMKQRRNMQKANKEVKIRTGEINAAIESGISGIRTSKAFANEKAEKQKFEKANEAFKKSRVGYYSAMGKFMASTEAAVGIMQVAVIAVGGFLIMRGEMDYIDLITFTLYVAAFISPIRKLMQFMELFTSGTAGFERFIEIMRTRPDIEDAPDAIELNDVKGEIRFEDVSFSYNDGTSVLEHINLTIKPGMSYALVGSSGGGKTTMCHLIPRFYDVTEGRILVDGHDVRTLTQESLRQNIGIIQQDVFLFAGTVMDNLRYGKPDASDAEVVAASKQAEIHEDIMQMPDGYDTFIGERGVVLSGGQKQRVSIARVILKNPPILIFDEATSALDSVTEAKIQKSLEMLAEGKTCLSIAHRLSTVKNADCIAVVDDKCIVESGTRSELLAKGGAYAELERAQMLAGEEQ